MKVIQKSILLIIALIVLSLSACAPQEDTLKDGYYNAQLAEYSHGWKEFITIMVKDGKIVTVEYNAKNESGFIKSWDNTYMQTMLSIQGTYPNEYTRYYASQLVGATDVVEIDAISGASSSHLTFQKLMEAVIKQSKKEDSTLAIVPVQ